MFHKSRDESQFKAFLRETVGIKHTRHIQNIIDWIKANDDRSGKGGEEGASEGGDMRVTISVEGNIGAGKSTFLDMLNSPVEGRREEEAGLHAHRKRVVPEVSGVLLVVRGGDKGGGMWCG